MNEKQIFEGLQKAQMLLVAYEETVKPIAEELARLKSLAVYGKEGCYSGDLGCWSTGINEICLHLKEAARGKSFEADKVYHEKAVEFEALWTQKTDQAGVRKVYVSGYY